MVRVKYTPKTRKIRDSERHRRYRVKLVNIGDQREKWDTISKRHEFKSDRDVAQFLVDSYMSRQDMEATGAAEIRQQRADATATSTPYVSAAPLKDISISSLSRGSDVSAVMSGIEDLGSTSGQSSPKRRKVAEGPEIRTVPSTPKTPRVKFDFTVDEAELEADDEDHEDQAARQDDPTYQPSEWSISLVHSDEDTGEEEVDLADEIHGLIQVEGPAVPPAKRGKPFPTKTSVDVDDVTEAKYIVNHSCLLKLADLVRHTTCSLKQCERPTKCSVVGEGSAAILTWTCDIGHQSYRWCSQQVLPNGVFMGNFQASAAILLSGNNYTKIALFAKFLGLRLPSQSSFHRVQANYVVPKVKSFWMDMKEHYLASHKGGDIIVSGDGRMDSPGYSAKYCTYTMMHQADKAIVALEVVDKRETNLKSGLMEALGFKRCMETLKKADINIVEVVTDAHPQISAIMKRSHHDIRHSYDTWHGAKNLGKKMCNVACTKGNEELKEWLPDLTNHFFHCASTCHEDVQIMKSKWVSMLNHITNIHSWGVGACEHAPITEEPTKRWINPQSSCWGALDRVVTDRRLLGTFRYYVTCQSTSELESFNNHVLMYASKRNAYSYQVYECRCFLAAIDYQKHLERHRLYDQGGKPRYRRSYSKASANWTVVPLKEAKKYTYMSELIVDIVNTYCTQHKDKPLAGLRPVPTGHPKLIAPTIAKSKPPPTAEIAAKLQRRIQRSSDT